MSTPIVTLGGKVLGGASTYGWDLTYGVKPAEQQFLLTTERAVTVPRGVPLTLEVSNVARPLKVEHAYALEVTAGPGPNQRVLRLADRRWLWSRKWVSSSFNVRRVAGDRGLTTEAGQPIELATIEPVIRYAKWSLDPPENGAVKWTARRVLEFVFGEIEQPFRFADDLPQVEIQDLVIEDDGAAAVERVLGFLPGADVYIDLDGTAVVVNTLRGLPGSEGTRTRDAAVLPGLERKHVGIGGDMVLTDRKALRPSKVVVLFTPEVEVRFDSLSPSATRTRDTPALINVAPSPDLTVTLSTGQTVARGTYVALETLWSTWGAFGIPNEALTQAKLCELGAAAGVLEQIYSRSAGQVFDPASAARARATVDSWRRLWQIDELFVQRISSIKPNRVALLNPATGARAKSEAYCDYMRRPNRKNPSAKGAIEGDDYGWTERGYAALLANAKKAPAEVSVVSESAGVIRTEPKLDPWGLADMILLGYPEGGTMPKNDGGAEANRTGVDAFAQWQQVKLTNDFQVATVLTVIPASPNNLDRFWKVEVTAAEAGFTGEGPPVYVRVFPEVMTARFAWSDEQGEAIKGAILRGSPLPQQQMVNPADVNDVAQASAKVVYTDLVDLPDTSSGPVSVDMDPAIKPVGSIGRVRHGLNNGLTTTLVQATGIRRPVQLWRFLDANTRAVILRLANEVES